MSVWVTSILAHPWESFSRDLAQKIASIVSGTIDSPRYILEPPLKSPEDAFSAHGNVHCSLANNFTLYFGAKVLILGKADPWSTFLTNGECRRSFLTACKDLAGLCLATEILLLPEGTAIEALLYDGAAFDHFKQAANKHWGPPNIEIDRIYREDELYRNNGKRVDYALIQAETLPNAGHIDTKTKHAKSV
jgi:hypothetical protein